MHYLLQTKNSLELFCPIKHSQLLRIILLLWIRKIAGNFEKCNINELDFLALTALQA